MRQAALRWTCYAQGQTVLPRGCKATGPAATAGDARPGRRRGGPRKGAAAHQGLVASGVEAVGGEEEAGRAPAPQLVHRHRMPRGPRGHPRRHGPRGPAPTARLPVRRGVGRRRSVRAMADSTSRSGTVWWSHPLLIRRLVTPHSSLGGVDLVTF